MNDACAVRLSESLPDLRGDLDGVVQWQRPRPIRSLSVSPS